MQVAHVIQSNLILSDSHLFEGMIFDVCKFFIFKEKNSYTPIYAEKGKLKMPFYSCISISYGNKTTNFVELLRNSISIEYQSIPSGTLLKENKKKKWKKKERYWPDSTGNFITLYKLVLKVFKKFCRNFSSIPLHLFMKLFSNAFQ